jgi:hypothetical protein
VATIIQFKWLVLILILLNITACGSNSEDNNTDTQPNPFSFSSQENAALNSISLSNSVTVSGINTQSPINISGGEYSVNGSNYTDTNSFVVSGDTIIVRLTSSTEFLNTTRTVLSIGAIQATFSVTTMASDTAPNAFNFLDQNAVEQASLYVSNTIIVSGINTSSVINVVGGEYAIDGGTYTNTAGTVTNGQTVSVRQTSSALPSDTTDTVLTIGGISDTFSVTTSNFTVPFDVGRAGNMDGVKVWQLPDAPNGDKPDQSWLAVGSDNYGEIYISGHDHISNSILYRLHQADGILRWVGDARTASETADNWEFDESAEKFHTRPTYHNGQVYVATLDKSGMNSAYLNTRGFHWYSYDILENEFFDLSAFEQGGVGAQQIQLVTIQKDAKNNLLYGMSIPENKLVRYDIALGQTTVLGKPVEWEKSSHPSLSRWNGYFYSNRFMWVDSRGRVYFTGGSSRNQWNQGEPASTLDHVWYHDPINGFGELTDFKLQGPNAMEVGQWDRAGEVLYTSDDQGNIYRFVDADASWSFVGKPDFSAIPSGIPKVWVFQLSADAEKIYIGLSDVSYPNAIWEFDIATGKTKELAKLSELDSQASTQDFITGYDSWDNNGSFYVSNFTMYNGVNVYMLGINPVRVKAMQDSSFELVEIAAQSTEAGVTVSRSGSVSDALDVLYEIRLFDGQGVRLDTILGETTINVGQSNIELTITSLNLPLANTFNHAEFVVIADGNDYVLSDVYNVVLDMP